MTAGGAAAAHTISNPELVANERTGPKPRPSPPARGPAAERRVSGGAGSWPPMARAAVQRLRGLVPYGRALELQERLTTREGGVAGTAHYVAPTCEHENRTTADLSRGVADTFNSLAFDLGLQLRPRG